MLDITLLRKDLAHVVQRLERRKSPQPYLDVERFGALETERKAIQTRTEELQARPQRAVEGDRSAQGERGRTALGRWPRWRASATR
jgi:seryl-tRNA synthetase